MSVQVEPTVPSTAGVAIACWPRLPEPMVDQVRLLASPAAMHQWRRDVIASGRTIGLVPTMGALHDGHIALIHEAKRHVDVVVVSIFVNPLQFNRPDDFDHYPRPIDDDLLQCQRAGVDAVYAPTASSMYPDRYQTFVEPGALAMPLEGADRPGHFRGVTTVVTKLFSAVQPAVAVFGQKDFQQLAIVRRMVTDLDMDIKIIGIPTVREFDGLALSSRNRRLSPDQRMAAVVVPAALDAISVALGAGETDAQTLHQIALRTLASEPMAHVDHVALVDPDTLESVTSVSGPTLVVLAVWFGDVRLIDNRVVQP